MDTNPEPGYTRSTLITASEVNAESSNVLAYLAQTRQIGDFYLSIGDFHVVLVHQGNQHYTER